MSSFDATDIQFRASGDRYLTVDFPNYMTLENTLNVLALDERIRSTGIAGVLETVATWRSILVHFDPSETEPITLRNHIEQLSGRLCKTEPIPSRIVRIPVRYGGRWGRDLPYVAEINHVPIEEVVERHSGSRHLVGMISFTPGQPNCMFLDRSKAVTAPKYREPRTYTPEGVIGLGGTSTCIYSVASAGGFQMIGYTPMPIYDPWQRLPQFHQPVLLRVADQIEFFSINDEQLAEINQHIREARYEVDIRDTLLNWDQTDCGHDH